MAGAMENIKTMNSVVRTLLVAAGCGVIGYGGYLGYNRYVLPASQAKEAIARLELVEKQNAELQNTVVLQSERIEKLQTSLKLIKFDRRMAHIEVLRKWDDENGVPRMEVEFTEIDRDGKQLGQPRKFQLSGNRLYIDSWLVKFEDHYIEGADLLRNATLNVFKEIYGDRDGPMGAQPLDSSASDENVPAGYADAQVTDFERKIWSDFWNVANDTAKQHDLGIRAAHGQANNILVEQGQTYIVELRASDGVTLRPADKKSLVN